VQTTPLTLVASSEFRFYERDYIGFYERDRTDLRQETEFGFYERDRTN
jgi:hypothetical protein